MNVNDLRFDKEKTDTLTLAIYDNGFVFSLSDQIRMLLKEIDELDLLLYSYTEDTNRSIKKHPNLKKYIGSKKI